MAQLGFTATILLFGMGLVLWAFDPTAYGIGFPQFVAYLTSWNIQGMVNLIMAALSNPLAIGSMVLVTLASFGSGNTVKYTVGMVVLIAMANILFLPFTFTTEALTAVPITIRYLVQGFFSLLLVFATMSFILEKDW